MKEERLSVIRDDLNEHLAKARQLRSQELARLSGQVFKLPRRILKLLMNKFMPGSKTINSVG